MKFTNPMVGTIIFDTLHGWRKTIFQLNMAQWCLWWSLASLKYSWAFHWLRREYWGCYERDPVSEPVIWAQWAVRWGTEAKKEDEAQPLQKASVAAAGQRELGGCIREFPETLRRGRSEFRAGGSAFPEQIAEFSLLGLYVETGLEVWLQNSWQEKGMERNEADVN